MARTQIATDSFTYSDGLFSSSDWANLNSAQNTFNVDTNKIKANYTSSSGDGAYRYTSGTFSDDQYAKATVSGWSGTLANYTHVGVIVRASGDTNTARDYYFMRWKWSHNSPTANTTELGRTKDGTETILATTTLQWANSDTIEIEVTGSTTISLKGFRNGSEVLSYSDNNTDGLTTGRPGAQIAGAPTTGPRLDDWEGGNIEAAVRKVVATVVDASGAAQANLTGVKWAFFDNVTPDALVAPVNKGTGETTDGSGQIEILIPNSTKTNGEVGFLVLSNTDGTTTQNPAAKCFAGPVTVTVT